MPDSSNSMNVLNLETRNAMDTRRMDHANAYTARANGLIKSASTSTCCANEDALFRRPHKKCVAGEENANFDETLDERELQSLMSSLSLSRVAALARNASFYEAVKENAAKKTLKSKFHLSHLKHFSDCNLNSIGLPTQQQRQHEAEGGEDKFAEFNTHRALDNVLVRLASSNGNGSIINFTSVNDIKDDLRAMSTTLSIQKVEEENVGSESESNENVDQGTKTERRRKNSVFEAEPPQTQQDDKIELVTSELKEETTPDDVNKENEVPVDTKETGETQPLVKEEKRFRRSSSLKMPKENGGSPAEKKIVRFADALGLDLIDVRTFLDELPSVPKSAYNDLVNDELVVERPQPLFTRSNPAPEKTLVPMFKQPHMTFSFLDRVRDNYVSLEYAKVCPTPVCSITGTVRVRNLDFCKSVYVRYSIDNWLTFNELQAVYVPDSCDGFSDKFAFIVYVYDVKVNQRVELAVRFHCSGSIFWDNNNGSNYVFQCLPSAPVAPSYFYSYNPTSDSCNSFY